MSEHIGGIVNVNILTQLSVIFGCLYCRFPYAVILLEYRGYFLFHVRVLHAGLHQQVVVIEIETAAHRIAAIIERGDELSHSPFHSCNILVDKF